MLCAVFCSVWVQTGAEHVPQSAEAAYAKLLTDLADRKISRRAAIAEANGFVVHFPKARHAKFVREMAEDLGVQVAQDSVHVPVNFASASEAQKIDEWVYELQFVGPAPTRAVMPSVGADSEAQLGLQGFVAVPGLIKALGDRRLTFQQFGPIREGAFPEPARVRDLALETLLKISGRHFAPANAPMDDAVAVRARAGANRWWVTASRLGEAAWLEESMRRGAPGFSDLAARLIQVVPGRAMNDIAAGFPLVHDKNEQIQTYRVVAQIPTSQATAFLQMQALHAPERWMRVMAASYLNRGDRAAATSTLLHEISRPGESNFVADSQLEMVLMTNAPLKAIEALSKNFDRFTVERKAGFLLGGGLQMSGRLSAAGGDPPAAKKDAATADRAIEDFLVRRLVDRSRTSGAAGASFLGNMSAPRICDLACAVLAARFKGPYRFHAPVTDQMSDEQCFANYNVWCAKRGLPALTAPARRRVPTMPPGQLAPIISDAVSASDQRRRDALQRLEADGLGALPALAAAATKLALTDPARKDVDAAAQRMSLTIAEVHVVGGKRPGMTRSLPRQGVPLTVDSLGRLIEWVASAPHATMTINREDDLSGVSVEVDLAPTAHHGPPPVIAYAVNVGGQADSQSLMGGAPYEAFLSQQCRPFFDRMLAAPPHTPFNFYFSSASR